MKFKPCRGRGLKEKDRERAVIGEEKNIQTSLTSHLARRQKISCMGWLGSLSECEHAVH